MIAVEPEIAIGDLVPEASFSMFNGISSVLSI
jgi:hypothetical protein